MTEKTKEYAKALFLLAKEEHTLSEVRSSLHLTDGLFRQNPDYLQLLCAPNLSKEERCGLIAEVFSQSVEDLVLHFLQLLCKKGDIRFFSDCVAEYDCLLQEDQGILSAAVQSAVPLSCDEREKLRCQLEKQFGRRVQMTMEVDPALLGGVVVHIDGMVLDGSLKHRLYKWKEGMRDAKKSGSYEQHDSGTAPELS